MRVAARLRETRLKYCAKEEGGLIDQSNVQLRGRGQPRAWLSRSRDLRKPVACRRRIDLCEHCSCACRSRCSGGVHSARRRTIGAGRGMAHGC